MSYKSSFCALESISGGSKVIVDFVSLLQVKVSSKTKHVVHFNVKAGDVIIWEFATKKRDIAFGEGMKSVEGADCGIL